MSQSHNTPESILVRLKDKICLALGIDIYKLKTLIDLFVVRNLTSTANSKSHFAKVNIYNELTKDKMTIKVFFKFLRIINIVKLRISITVVTASNTEATVSEDIRFFSNTPVDVLGDNDAKD